MTQPITNSPYRSTLFAIMIQFMMVFLLVLCSAAVYRRRHVNGHAAAWYTRTLLISKLLQIIYVHIHHVLLSIGCTQWSKFIGNMIWWYRIVLLDVWWKMCTYVYNVCNWKNSIRITIIMTWENPKMLHNCSMMTWMKKPKKFRVPAQKNIIIYFRVLHCLRSTSRLLAQNSKISCNI